MYRTKVTSPDRETFRKVSKVLSTNGVSLAASNPTTLTQTITSKVTPKLTETLEAMGATVEQTV